MACFPLCFSTSLIFVSAAVHTSFFGDFGLSASRLAAAPCAPFQTGIGFACPHSGAILAASAHLGLIILAKYGPACVQLSDEAEPSAGRERSGIRALFIPLQSRASCRAIVCWGRGALTDEMKDGGHSALVSPRAAAASLSGKEATHLQLIKLLGLQVFWNVLFSSYIRSYLTQNSRSPCLSPEKHVKDILIAAHDGRLGQR